MANDFYIHGWVVRVDAPFFPLSQTRGNAWELPVGPKQSWQVQRKGERVAVKTFISTNKDNGSSGLQGKIRSLIPLSSILHGLH